MKNIEWSRIRKTIDARAKKEETKCINLYSCRKETTRKGIYIDDTG